MPKIRFIDWTGTGRTGGVGIYGLPSEGNDSGEFQIGDEIEIDGEVPTGWLSKVEIISGKPKADAEMVANPASDEAPRRGRPRSGA